MCPLPKTIPSREAFSGLSDDYQRCRPDYPSEIVEWIVSRLGLDSSHCVVDVGAGTGIFTRRLIACGLRPLALDLSGEMLGQLTSEVCCLGSADCIPLSDSTVHAITAAQAFHWFDPEPTLAEWHRVLRPGGGVALVWNDRDVENSVFCREFEALVAHHNPKHRLGYRDLPVGEILAAGDLFDSVESRVLVHPWRMSHAEFFGFAHSVSYIMKALTSAQLREFDASLKALLEGHFPTGEVEVPLRCRAWTARKHG